MDSPQKISTLKEVFESLNAKTVDANKNLSLAVETPDKNTNLFFEGIKELNQQKIINTLSHNPKLIDMIFPCLNGKDNFPKFTQHVYHKEQPFALSEGVNFNIFQYSLLTGMNNVAVYLAEHMNEDNWYCTSSDSMFIQPTLLKNFTYLLMADNNYVFSKIPQKMLLKILNCEQKELLDKIYKLGSGLGIGLNSIYPQKIYNNLIDQGCKINYFDSISKNKWELIAQLRDNKVLKELIETNKNLTSYIIKDVFYGRLEKYFNNTEINFQDPAYKEQTILNLIKIHYDIYQELPQETITKYDNGAEVYLKSPLLNLFITFKERNDRDNNLKDSSLGEKNLSFGQVKIENFLNIKEVRTQAAQFYNEDLNLLKLQISNFIGETGIGLSFLTEIGFDWETHGLDFLNTYLSENVKSLKSGGDKRTIAPFITKFIDFCVLEKNELLKGKNRKRVINYLEKMDLPELSRKIEQGLIEKHLGDDYQNMQKKKLNIL